MPAEHPKFWLKRVEANLTRGDRAPWADGIAELDVVIQVFGEGPSEENLIAIPVSDFEPEVLIDNSAYPLAIQDYTDEDVIVKLKKFSTRPTRIREDQTIGASYDKVDNATKGHTVSILKKKFSTAIYAMAPAANTIATPVLKATGRSGKYQINADGEQEEIIWKVGTRLRLTHADLVDLRAACVAAGIDFDLNMVRLVLCDDHVGDLQYDRKNFPELVSMKSGDPAPVILGFKIYSFANCPYYNGTTKLAYGAVPAANQFQASVVFYEGNVAKKTGFTRQYYDKPNTTEQAHLVAYRHYFLFAPKRLKWIAAITSGVAA